MTVPPPGLVARLAVGSPRARRTVLALWLLALALLVGLGGRAAGEFEADYSDRGSDSSAAVALLASGFPAQSGASSTSSSTRTGRWRPSARGSRPCSRGSAPTRWSPRPRARGSRAGGSPRTRAPASASCG